MEFADIICPFCGRTIPEDAPQGLCPLCLISATMDFVISSSQCDKLRTQGRASAMTVVADQQQLQTSTAESLLVESASGVRPRRLGDYELHEEIGQGGMGTVYRAKQVRLNRQVALKMIRSGKFSTEIEIRRFHIEAQAAAHLDHPAIVPIFEIQEHEGLHFFTMAYVEGEPLSSRLRTGPLPPRQAANLLKSVAIGIAYAHQQGVVHRDLKPSNILIDLTGQPRISDFGLAKRVGMNSSSTARGEILGTPSYMPPEQAQGNIDQIGPLSDVYSLGAVLYAALTGSPPFQSASPLETVRQVIELEPVAPRKFNPAIPQDLETITLKCLEKEPARRYPNAQAFADDLERYLDGHPITARPISQFERIWRWANRRRDLSLMFVALIVFAVAGATTIGELSRRHAQTTLHERIEGLVKQIETAEFTELPRLIDEICLIPNPVPVEHALSDHVRLRRSPEAELRLSLARSLLQRHVDASTCQSWLKLPLDDLFVVSGIVEPLSVQVRALLKPVILAGVSVDSVDAGLKLRAICLFVSLDSLPDASRRDTRSSQTDEVASKIDWGELSDGILQLVQENPAEFKAARELLRPAARDLTPPLKDRIARGLLPDSQRNLAISLLAELVLDSPEEIAELACLVDSRTFNLVTRYVERSKEQVIPFLLRHLQQGQVEVADSQEGLKDEKRVALATSISRSKAADARRRAMAAAWLYRIGQAELIWANLQNQPDESLPYAILDRIPVVGGSAQPLLNQFSHDVGLSLSTEPSIEHWPRLPMWKVPEAVSQLHMMILLAGELAEGGLITADHQEYWQTILPLLLRHHPDCGIHSSCEWTLRKLGAAAAVEQAQQQFSSVPVVEDRGWFVTSEGSTMAFFKGPISYQAGANWLDPERVANTVIDPVTAKETNTDREPFLMRVIPRDFAIATKEVSLREFLRFDSRFHEQINLFSSPSLEHPVNNVNWYVAAEYCNWLSKQAGLDPSEWCFVPNQQGRYAEGMSLAENYLHRTGYRMPTEAEWEFACRAGTSTPRFFGHCRELLPQFAWFRDNSRERGLIVPGTMKPNRAGLFDMFGNVIEWCIDPYAGRPGNQSGVVPDLERGLTVDAEAWRVMRGGHVYAEANELRATDLWTFRPIVTNGHYGLRLARTLKVHDPVDASSLDHATPSQGGVAREPARTR